MKTRFILSAASSSQFPQYALPEIALAGRSNVGKSSLINRLTGMSGLARVSGNPGCTRTLNFFVCEEKVGFVDLPGYGFAKVSARERNSWSTLIDDYLKNRRNLMGVVVIMDASIAVSPLDLQLLAYLDSLDIFSLPVGTKTDKLPANRKKILLEKFKSDLGEKGDDLVLFSSKTGEGRVDTMKWIEKVAGVGRLC